MRASTAVSAIPMEFNCPPMRYAWVVVSTHHGSERVNPQQLAANFLELPDSPNFSGFFEEFVFTCT